MIKTNFEVIISRVHGADTHDVEIRVRDTASRIEFLELHLTKEQFATCLFSQQVVVEGELRNLEQLGMDVENKTEFVKCALPWSEAERYKALKKHEVDGWKARSGDINNHHNIGSNGVSVVFFRKVGKSYIQTEHEQMLAEIDARKPGKKY